MPNRCTPAFRRPLSLLVLAALYGLGASVATNKPQPPPCSQCRAWNTPQKPFRIFGNTYYVGPHGLSSLLVTSPAGHVLMDGALPESVKQIVANIRSLGFRIEDVKLIVNSHVHFDHAGGIAELQRLSGARVAASSWSAQVLKTGGVATDDPQLGEIQPVARVAHVETLKDGEGFRFGDVVVTAHLTPGHTPGGTSWTWQSCEGTNCLNMVYADSITAISAAGFKFSSNAASVQSFEKSFAFLSTVPCEVLVTTHPDASALWDRLDARQRGVSPDPMIDTTACRSLVERGREQLTQRLAAERKPSSK
jgi:metallo-beta-lactamase class B